MRKNEAFWVESRKRWQINVQSEGDRRTFTSSKAGKKGKIEAEKKADAWLESHLIGENTRCEILLDRFFDHLKLSTSKAHWRQQDNYIRNHIKPVIGQKKIGRLTENDIQYIIDKAYTAGLAKKTLCNLRACCTSFLKYCRKERCTILRPENLTIPNKAKKSSKGIMPRKDLTILFSSNSTLWRGDEREDWYIHAYRVAVLTGLRPGELLGLQWNDIVNDTITIRRSINDDSEITDGKNENAQRCIALTGLVLSELAAQKMQLLSAGISLYWVFPSKYAEPTKQHTLRRFWDRYKEYNGMNKSTTLYELRHTYVSINDEMPEGLKKKVLGHSENMDTEKIYGHLKDDDLKRAAQYSDSAFRKILKEKVR